ncbi:unnamed protein product [Paramecium octaurelia]|uniref:Uncharacterized protein n=1 Tax=Paramecium octaurelia TaxID=43137 RepID=A0A8S1XHX7_PAROT|nr:unnamed protein product [Paramecium octaurelia]
MNLSYDLATVTNPVDDVPPLGLSVCQQVYLELAMLAMMVVPWITLSITTSALLCLLTYMMLIILVVYFYIFFMAQGKRVLEFYMAG